MTLQWMYFYVLCVTLTFCCQAPDMFTRETCDEIEWCKSGGKSFYYM